LFPSPWPCFFCKSLALNIMASNIFGLGLGPIKSLLFCMFLALNAMSLALIASVSKSCICLCRKKQLLSEDRARRLTSNDSIKIFSSAGDKPENIGRAVLSYYNSAAKAQQVCSSSASSSSSSSNSSFHRHSHHHEWFLVDH